MGGLVYWRPRPSPTLAGTDVIVLADFENSTGDTLFDGTLRQGLSVGLEQSPFLRVLPAWRVEDTLKLMGKPADTPVARQVALEVCQRTGSRAVISGSITPLIDRYILTLEATDCPSGDPLVQVRTEARGKVEVLGALDRAAIDIRHKLGELRATLQKYDTPLAEATTPLARGTQS